MATFWIRLRNSFGRESKVSSATLIKSSRFISTIELAVFVHRIAAAIFLILVIFILRNVFFLFVLFVFFLVRLFSKEGIDS